MKDITAKLPYDGVSAPAPADEVLPNTEYNDRRVELQGAVTDSSQALAEADTGQLSKAMFANGVAAQSMLDGGGVNTVVLTPVTGPNGLRVATPVSPDYSSLDGAIFNFKANNTNTGNMTVNVGQSGAALIGALKLFMSVGVSTEVPAGFVISGRYFNVRFDISLDGGSGGFVLLSSGVWDPEIYTGQESVRYPNGRIVKTGVLVDVVLNQTFHPVVFAAPFPTAIVNVSATISMTTTISGTISPLIKKGIADLTVDGMEIAGDHDTAPGTGDIYWTAIGY